MPLQRSEEAPGTATPGKRATLRVDLLAGFASALVPLASTFTPALIALQPLGTTFTSQAIVAGMLSVAIGNTAIALAGGRALSLSGPRATSSLVIAAMLIALLRTDETFTPAALLGLMCLCTLLAGLALVVMGLMRVGTLVRFVPFPVIAGYSAGTGVLIAWTQLPGVLGIADVDTLKQAGLGAARLVPVALALGALAFVWSLSKVRPKWPASVLALPLGALADVILVPLLGREVVGPTIGEFALHLGSGEIGDHARSAFAALAEPKVVRIVLVYAGALAVMLALDSLLGALTIETMTHARIAASRELVTQGLANVATGVTVGIPVSVSPIRAIDAHRGGARGAAALFAHAWVPMALVFVATPVFVRLPLAVLSAVMMVVAWSLVDPWLRRTVRQAAGAGRVRGEAAWSLGVALFVMVATALVDLLFAFGAGLLASLVLFVRNLNRDLVVKEAHGAGIASRRLYGQDDASWLRSQASRISVITLQGPLFFGTAETASRLASRAATKAQYVVLDLQRVRSLDASAARVLGRLGGELAARGRLLLIAHRGAHWSQHSTEVPDAQSIRAFPTLDEAVEWIEERLLDERPARSEDAELPLAALDLLRGMNAAQVDAIAGSLRRTEARADSVLFREGDPGDELFMVARGRVSIRIDAPGGAIRLVTFCSGLAFGDLALLDGSARSASAVCDTDCVLWSLSRTALRGLERDHPDVAVRLLENIAQSVGARLRANTATLKDLST